jgi:rfaE bifunctional protein nucleotidyltransferase chain/domain
MQGPAGKIRSLEQADAWVTEQRAAGQKVGFTCGAFDILHAGHAQYLAAAREKCDRLLVAVNTDESIQRYKNPLRPINPWDQRAYVVAALESVDCVTTLAEDRPLTFIERWKPEFYIKGGDYKSGSLRSSDAVTAYGGQTIFIPVEFPSSTTTLIEYIHALDKHAIPEPAHNKPPVGLVLLDRDGTLVRDAVFDPRPVELLAGVADGLRALQSAGYRLCIVTNQQGIGLGYFGYRDFVDANRVLLRQLGTAGIIIAKIYFCPHSLADTCECRKPGAALLRRAMAEQGVGPERTFLIGDSEADMLAARNGECHGLLVGKNGSGLSFEQAANLILSSN